MGFKTTVQQSDLGYRKYNSVFANEILLLSPSEIQKLFFDKYPNSNIEFLLINNDKDIYLGTKECINFFDHKLREEYCKFRSFILNFCKKELFTLGWIEPYYLQFPNSEYYTFYVTSFRISEPTNKEMVTVKSEKMVEDYDYVLKINYSQKATSDDVNKLLKLLTEWEKEATFLGFNNEKIKMISQVSHKNNINIYFSYTGLIHFPFLELYLRLYSTSPQIRPIGMKFSTCKSSSTNTHPEAANEQNKE